MEPLQNPINSRTATAGPSFIHQGEMDEGWKAHILARVAALEAFKDKMAAGLASLEEFKGRWLDEMAGLKRAMENISAAMEMA